MSASMSHAASAEPDLTPMLDMVFQLITFFMLVINFKGASMDLSLKLPILGSARPVETGGSEEILILNIDKTGQINVYGTPKDVEPYIKLEASRAALKAREENRNFKLGENDLPGVVVIRADRSTPFSQLNKIIKTCQKYKFRRFALKAMNREDPK
jgi:biopolymer transport protein ExbD